MFDTRHEQKVFEGSNMGTDTRESRHSAAICAQQNKPTTTTERGEFQFKSAHDNNLNSIGCVPVHVAIELHDRRTRFKTKQDNNKKTETKIILRGIIEGNFDE